MGVLGSTDRYEKLPVELWESILLHLNPRTLLTSATRVCHAWTALIRESTAIQQSLFFAPDTQLPAQNKTHSSLLIDAFPSVFYQSSASRDHDYTNDSQCSALRSWDFVKHPEKISAYMRPEASWRRMLIQQPPIFKIGMWTEQYAYISGATFYEIPEDPRKTETGIRMETIVEAIFFDSPLASFDVDLESIIWAGQWPEIVREKLDLLERCRGRKLDVGLIIHAISSAEDYIRSGGEEEEEEEEEESLFEVGVYRKVEAEYWKLGLEPRIAEKGWRSNEFSWDPS
ncbi:hypothetical protein N7492_009979 [Penicillium capsulatum]|uniref:F-box domain-containing protein n=1 Tax=Penicillium capsulatum TaxID=69766 RepID=A0A9W9HMK3_9EURO|nr:hypothetical protein N7492_009979 [Penicillium capsulatum]KAJ6112488.1 hypothetical protein N7512_007812 [Penicillium capsulatum]